MTHLEVIKKKIFNLSDLIHAVARWRFLSKKIVFTNGCFDILHLGHIDYLSKAADLGHILVVGVNTDASTTRLKGPTRPINDENQRTLLLASLHFTDAIILFDEPTPYELIKAIQPDFLVKGADYKPEEIVGYDIVKAYNGEIITIPYIEGYSTTAIEQKMQGK